MATVRRKKESGVLREVQLALSKAGCTVFRNETAGAFVGQVVYVSDGEVSLRNAQRIQAGLCVGSSDLIGWTADGRFLAVETKAVRGRATDEQRRFIEAVRASGGVAGVARSAAEALALLAGG